MNDKEFVPLPTFERELEMHSTLDLLEILWRLHHEKTFGEFISMVICGSDFPPAMLYTGTEEELQKHVRDLRNAESRQFDIPLNQRI